MSCEPCAVQVRDYFSCVALTRGYDRAAARCWLEKSAPLHLRRRCLKRLISLDFKETHHARADDLQ